MGARGPLPEPTALRILKGNPSGKPLPVDEPQPYRLPSIEPPADLGAIAADVWRRNAAELDRLGLLTMIDWEIFYRYCWTAEQWYKMKADVDARGALFYKTKKNRRTKELEIVSTVQNPAWYMERSYAQELSRMEMALGMNPSARTRISIGVRGGDGGGGQQPDHDPFA